MAITRAKDRPELVDIVETFVDAMQVDLSGSSWTDNLDGTFTLNGICRTYWLKVGDTFTDTVTSEEYTVTAIDNDAETVTISATAEPTNTTVTLNKPKYYHGTVIDTNLQFNGVQFTEDMAPLIYFLEQYDETYFTNDSILDREANIRLFFLESANFQDWTTDQHYENAISLTREILNYFVYEVLFKTKAVLSDNIEDYITTNRVKFGVYTTDRGNTNHIFDKELTGIELNITLPITKNYVNCFCDGKDDNIIKCAPVTIFENGSFLQYVDSGDRYSYNTAVCSDGTVNVNKSDSGLISAVTVASGGTVNYNVSDSNVSNSDDTYSVNVKATENLELPDITHTDSDGSSVPTPAQTPFVCTPATDKLSSQPYKTGQQTSYQTGDDGDLEEGNGASYAVLSENNPLGTTRRFTDLAGNELYGTTFSSGGYAVDWSSIDYVNETVLVYWTAYTNSSALATWSAQVTAGLVDPTSGTYPTGWYLCNHNELSRLFDFSGSLSSTKIFPNFFEIQGTSADVWTSTTYPTTTTSAMRFVNYQNMQVVAKTSTSYGYQCRLFTFTELGI